MVVIVSIKCQEAQRGFMDKEGIVTAINKLILPELEAIKGNQAKMDVRRIDETNKRIDEINSRIDQLTFQVGKIAQEMERVRREEAVIGDIFTRFKSLETKTAHL